ncbi:hypothetical protein [Agarivorans sp. DSG3-1]|uniref:hypothetical protein n=1 Tax=Agarivorans sp. DSG3-1 TaxID=3342249 RepID=UPI00398F4BED
MELKLISELIKEFGAPSYILLYSGLILYLQKKIREYYSTNRSRHSESLQNLISYLKESENRDFFIVEQLMLDHFRVQIPYRGIKLILNSDTPTENLFYYRSGRRYLEFSEQYNSIIYWKGKSNLWREFVIAWFNYVVVGGVGVAMLLSSHLVIEYEILRYIGWFSLSIYLIFIGFMGLDSIVGIANAKRLVAKYNRKN